MIVPLGFIEEGQGMLKKTLLTAGCVGLVGSAFAGHVDAKPQAKQSKKATAKVEHFKHHTPLRHHEVKSEHQVDPRKQAQEVKKAQALKRDQHYARMHPKQHARLARHHRALHHQAALEHGQATWPSSIKIPQLERVKINGFLSAGFGRIDEADTQYGIPNYGTVGSTLSTSPFSLIGLQFSANLTDKLNAVVQLVASGNARDGHNQYDVRAEWGFLRYALTPDLKIRAGRFRLPIFLYSDTAQVGYSFPWVTPPNEVYRLVPFFNFNAVDATFSQDIGQSNWTFALQPFFGAERFKFDLYNNAYPAATHPPGVPVMNPGQLPMNVLRFHASQLVGGAFSLTNPMMTLRASLFNTKIDTFVDNPTNPTNAGAFVPLPNGQLNADQNVFVYDLAARINASRFLVLGEYAHRKAFLGVASLTGYYATLGVHLGSFLPNFTYAHLTTTDSADLAGASLDPFSEAPEAQESMTYGVNYTFNPSVVLKLSAARITPLAVAGVMTNGLFDLPVFKRHVWLSSVSVSAIF
jgi:hypothetical protein